MRDERAGLLRSLAQEGLEAATVAARLPRRIDTVVTRLDEGRLAVTAPALERRVARLERTLRRLVSVLPLAHALLAGVVGRAMRRGRRAA